MEANNLNDVYLSRDELIKLSYCSFLEYVGSCKCNSLGMAQWIDYNCVNDYQLKELLEETNNCISDYDEECSECGECFLGAMKHLRDLILQRLPQPQKQPQQMQLPENLLKLLQQKGYIENTAKPYKWVKSNSKTHGINPNKTAIFDLLCLLEYPDEVITNIKLLNEVFVFPNDKPIRANNLTDHKDSKGNLKRPIISEYHTELESIVRQSKEK